MVVALIARHLAAIAATGAAIGLAVALALTQVMASLLFQISPSDPLTFAAIAGFLALVAVVAGIVPARRAARIDPVDALRAEG
jgi:putative ABC transport system permease protein